MGKILDHWLTRLVIVAGVTYAGFKFGPKLVSSETAKGAVKTLTLAIGGVAGTAIVVANAPVVGPALGKVLDGKLPVSTPAAQPST